MESHSSVLLVSCDESFEPEEIVRLMLEELPEALVRPGISVFPWHISNKYYEVDVNLCCLRRKELQTMNFSRTVEGLVLYFDSSRSDGLSDVDGWMPFLDYDAEVKILVCKKCCEEGVSLASAHEWCLREKFELVEIDGVSEDEDFPETVGTARIKQALSAHVWPNLSLKQRNEQTGPNCFREGVSLLDSLETDAGDTDDFGFLFFHLLSMKEKAASLPSEERKSYAEKVVTAYWNAIGGDSSELSDDSSTSEQNYNQL